jgi:hypothetical protein
LDLPLRRREFAVELGDQSEQALQPASGRLGQLELGEETPPARPEQLGAS